MQRPNGLIDESRVTVETPDKLHVFDAEFPVPAQALRDPAAIEAALRALQR